MTPEKIKEIRLKAGLTQEAFAWRVGVACATVNKWERGKTKVSRLAVDKIRQLFLTGAAL